MTHHMFLPMVGLGVVFGAMSLANAQLLTGFESGTLSFSAYTGEATLTTGTVGVTEGSAALQIQTNGNYVGIQSFEGLWLAPIIAGVSAGDQLKLDVTVNPVNPGADLVYALLQIGANSGGGAGGNSFQTLTQQDVPINGTTTTLTFNLAELNTVGPDETFLGFVLTVNSAAGVPVVFSIDNVRIVPVPEPGSAAALISLGGFVLTRRRFF